MNEQHLTRKELARRWNCSVETIKRKEKSQRNPVIPLKMGERFLRYRLSDIERIEREAEAGNP
ncbi:MAG: hypothetical protein EOP09_00135 [Proteobacteria bacterium]|nr:MAG: hypothetical protein EOP09_00135 [Pseudomonadota bacterium]